MLLSKVLVEALIVAVHPNVVEMKAETLINLLESSDQWQQFCDSGAISASGTNSNLGNLFAQVGKLMKSKVRTKNGE
jgi:hypothetical protein